MAKRDLLTMSYDELASIGELDAKPFRAAQIWEWIYQKGAESFDEMKNLPKDLRAKLAERFKLNVLDLAQRQISADGTTKFLFEFEDEERIETVLIPTKKRNTVCVSTQVGCGFGCKFCASGIGGFKRDLTTAEIIAQILDVKKYAEAGQYPVSGITHIVFMGIGEPLDNYSSVMKAVRVINDKRGLNIGARRITISTCGIIPKIMELAKECMQVELSVSLHGYDNASRNALMPVNRRYPFDDLIKTCREYVRRTNRQITFEYVMIKGLTCSAHAAEKLGTILKGLLCKINLIFYNENKEFSYDGVTAQEAASFKKALDRYGVHSVLRAPRGRDLSAACGQLRRPGKK